MSVLSEWHSNREDALKTFKELFGRDFNSAGKVSMCKTCWTNIRGYKVPVESRYAGFRLPDIDQRVAVLSRMEEKMISAYLIFTTIIHLPQGGQLKNKGNLVHVPMNHRTFMPTLPRLPSSIETITFALKRRMADKKAYFQANVNVDNVLTACAFLQKQPLYREKRIRMLYDEEIRQRLNTDIEQILERQSEESANDVDEDDADPREHDEDDDNMTETMIASVEGLADLNEANKAYHAAPTENQKPQSVVQRGVLELTFPTIFQGVPLEPCITIKPDKQQQEFSMSKKCKHLLQHRDRRCARRGDVIFAFARATDCERMNRNISIAKRYVINKRTNEEMSISARDMMNAERRANLLKKNTVYTVIRNLPNSSGYWEQQRKDVLARVAQLGPAHIFLTLSAADTQWTELLCILKRTLDNVVISEQEAQELDYREKLRLIREDPVAVVQYFDHRLNEQIKLWRIPGGPFGAHPVEHHYVRVEYQLRGSAHVHCMLWLKNPPSKESNESALINFIDSIMTCDVSVTPVTAAMAKLQRHRHTHTCQKQATNKKQQNSSKKQPTKPTVVDQERNSCRFRFPLFPMASTCILHPLDPTEPNKRVLRQRADDIQNYLEKEHRTADGDLASMPSFHEMLATLKLDEASYEKVVRSRLKRSTVSLRRTPAQAFTNGFNIKIFSTWKANMDIQYIMSIYQVVNYIVSYLTKGNQAMSKAMNDLEKSSRTNQSTVELLQKAAAAFLKTTEYCAQEAAQRVLSIPFARATEAVVFINTLPIHQRGRLFKKSLHEFTEGASRIRNNNDDDNDDENQEDFAKNFQDKYSARPDEQRNICFAEFAVTLKTHTHNVSIKLTTYNERYYNFQFFEILFLFYSSIDTFIHILTPLSFSIVDTDS